MFWEDLGWKLYWIGKATKKKPQKHWRKCPAVSDLKGSNYLVYQKGVAQELGEPLIWQQKHKNQRLKAETRQMQNKAHFDV